MYAFVGEENGKRAKGAKKSVLSKTITFDDYKQCLNQEESNSRSMAGLRSHLHHIYGETVYKKPSHLLIASATFWKMAFTPSLMVTRISVKL